MYLQCDVIISVTMCTTPDESYNHEELLPPFLANQLAFYKDDHVLLQVEVEDKFYSVAISYQSSTSKFQMKPYESYYFMPCRFGVSVSQTTQWIHHSLLFY